jgi:hypothetical protein
LGRRTFPTIFSRAYFSRAYTMNASLTRQASPQPHADRAIRSATPYGEPVEPLRSLLTPRGGKNAGCGCRHPIDDPNSRRPSGTTGHCAFPPKTGIGERRQRQIIRYQQTWRPLSAHVADPRRSLCAWAGSRQAGSKKPVAWENAAAATPQHCRRRARQQECADRLELAYQRQRL